MMGQNFLSKLGRSPPIFTIDEVKEKAPKSKLLLEAEQRRKDKD